MEGEVDATTAAVLDALSEELDGSQQQQQQQQQQQNYDQQQQQHYQQQHYDQPHHHRQQQHHQHLMYPQISHPGQVCELKSVHPQFAPPPPSPPSPPPPPPRPVFLGTSPITVYTAATVVATEASGRAGEGSATASASSMNTAVEGSAATVSALIYNHDHSGPTILAPTTTTTTVNTNPGGGRYAGELYGDPIYQIEDMDVLNGRGAAVNARPGNTKFRALCFAHKALFDVGNHAAKRRIATDIVSTMINQHESRFLRKGPQQSQRENQGDRVTKKGDNHDSEQCYYAMTFDQAILKAAQIMRDYKRPDRVGGTNDTMTEQQQKHLQQKRGGNCRSAATKKRSRSVESTPMGDVAIPYVPSEPLVEMPSGVHSHDILSGRGAFVNGHVGNATLRSLALARKAQFDDGDWQTKRQLANEIFEHIKKLEPPGRFLKRIDAFRRVAMQNEGSEVNIIGEEWEELKDEKAITKCCQTMRDIARPDRQERGKRCREDQKQAEGMKIKHLRDCVTDSEEMGADNYITAHVLDGDPSQLSLDHVTNEMLTELAEKAAVEAVEGVVDEALHGTSTVGTVHNLTPVERKSAQQGTWIAQIDGFLV